MATIKGFWSYVHDDDAGDNGRIAQLRHDLVAEFGLLTGETLDLFLDSDDIEWGDDWRGRIDERLAGGAFFIPVLTPRYFQSAECRGELRAFADRATELGIRELILPLLYSNVPALRGENADDPLIALVATFQWVDWTDLRLSDPNSEAYRRGVSKLAERLVEANRSAEEVAIASNLATSQPDGESEDGSEGWLDVLARAEEAGPEWALTINAINEEVSKVNPILERATQDIQRATDKGKGLAARLTIARRVANELAEPAERINALGTEYAEQLHALDHGNRLVIQRIGAEVENDPANLEQACTYFNALRTLNATARESLAAVQVMIDAMKPLESMSKDLRKPLRQMREGLVPMLEAQEVTDEWVRLIDETDIDCPLPLAR